MNPQVEVHLTEELVALLLEQGLTDAEREGVYAHADQCEECRRLLADAAGAEANMDDAPSWVDEGSVDVVLGRTRHRLGRYVLLRVLGAGSLGAVYAAYDPELDRKVAIKVVRPTAKVGADAQALLLREGKALARLAHPNVVTVYDAGVVPSLTATGAQEVYIVMELVEGKTLRSALLTPTSIEQRLRWLRQVALGVAAAHVQGIVHRDIKPENVLIGSDGRARVTDFGLARASVADADAGGRTAESGRQPTALHRTQAIVGTPLYMAPEQMRG
jgi:serine/threonine protein kinase